MTLLFTSSKTPQKLFKWASNLLGFVEDFISKKKKNRNPRFVAKGFYFYLGDLYMIVYVTGNKSLPLRDVAKRITVTHQQKFQWKNKRSSFETVFQDHNIHWKSWINPCQETNVIELKWWWQSLILVINPKWSRKWEKNNTTPFIYIKHMHDFFMKNNVADK